MSASSSPAPAPATVLESLSNDLSAAVRAASASMVAIHARRRIPSSGIIWRPGIVVTTHHTIQREDNITVTLADDHRIDPDDATGGVHERSAGVAGGEPQVGHDVARHAAACRHRVHHA